MPFKLVLSQVLTFIFDRVISLAYLLNVLSTFIEKQSSRLPENPQSHQTPHRALHSSNANQLP